VKPERPERQKHRHRACHKNEDGGDRQAWQENTRQFGGRSQQPQDQKECHLRQPGQPVMHLQHGRQHTDAPVTENDTGEIDGEKATTAQGIDATEKTTSPPAATSNG